MGLEASAPLDLRKLRYFVAVAEELHFGRAADRLYIAQPVLSRAIRRLEQELGSDLFTRTSRNVTLTPSGERLLHEARELLSAADAAQRRMHNLAAAPTTLSVGFFVGDHCSAALRRFGEEFPDVAVRLERIYWDDQESALRDGRVDVAFAHLPIDERGIEILPFRDEPCLAMLWRDHPLAGRESLGLADLADDPVIIHRGANPAWQAYHIGDPRPDGRRPRFGPEVANVEEKLEMVAAGLAVSFVPASVADAQSNADVTYVPMRDLGPVRIALAWPAQRRTPLVDAFVDAVRQTMPRPYRGVTRNSG